MNPIMLAILQAQQNPQGSGPAGTFGQNFLSQRTPTNPMTGVPQAPMRALVGPGGGQPFSAPPPPTVAPQQQGVQKLPFAGIPPPLPHENNKNHPDIFPMLSSWYATKKMLGDSKNWWDPTNPFKIFD